MTAFLTIEAIIIAVWALTLWLTWRRSYKPKNPNIDM